ncbi:MAG: ketoacyl-ACP synthase III [Tuberibacillus sp.]
MLSKARITGIGTYVPERVLTNFDLEKMVDTNDEWIVQRTGIRERRIAAEDEFTSDLCVKAVHDMLNRFPVTVEDVDFIIVNTITPDYKTPSVASHIQGRLGIEHTGSMDINAACAGFTYALHLANGLISSGLHKKILVLGADTLSKITNYEDRTTCILFGDGAGCALVEYDEDNPGFIAAHLRTNGKGGKNVYATNHSGTMDGEQLIKIDQLVQNGREVYKWAVTAVPNGMRAISKESGLELNQIDWFIPHSANLRIIQSICEKSRFPFEKVLTSQEFYGNTSSATIPLALDLGLREGKVKSGDLVLMYGFGGGLTHSGQLIKWTI